MDATAPRKIIHCDCDCFYAAVEIRDRPELSGRPVAVGGAPDGRGVVATCNYEARRYGVHSAMPTARALRLCPDLVVLRTDMERYRTVSRQVTAIFRRFTDVIEPLSLDEAYLDVTGREVLRGSATLIAEAIRRAVRDELGITISAGVAPNKFLAKVASDWNKPDGQFVIRPEQVATFVAGLGVERLPGVGPRNAEKLAALDVRTCADLARIDPVTLTNRFGVFGHRLWELARGVDARPVQPRSRRKSVSVERTFAEDVATLDGCRGLLGELEDRLDERLARAGIGQETGPTAGTDMEAEPPHRCFVKVRFDDFTTTTAEQPYTRPTSEAFRHLLEVAWDRGRRPVRLLGIGVGFRSRRQPGQQLTLFPDADEPPRR